MSWVAFAIVLMLTVSGLSLLFRVALGVDPRPVALAEFVAVIAGCCVPAIALPTLWSWERQRSRVTVQLVALGVVPICIIALAITPGLIQRLGVHVAVDPAVSGVNTIGFSSLAALACMWLGRRTGTVMGIFGYVIGIGLQALEVPLLVPLQDGHSFTTALLLTLAVSTVALASLGHTLGRTERTLQA